MSRPITNLRTVHKHPIYTPDQWDSTKDRTTMTQLLEKALTEVYKLPPDKQDAIAALILEELEDEQLWNKVFAASEDKIAQLAGKVRADIKAGRIRKIGIDEL